MPFQKRRSYVFQAARGPHQMMRRALCFTCGVEQGGCMVTHSGQINVEQTFLEAPDLQVTRVQHHISTAARVVDAGRGSGTSRQCFLLLSCCWESGESKIKMPFYLHPDGREHFSFSSQSWRMPRLFAFECIGSNASFRGTFIFVSLAVHAGDCKQTVWIRTVCFVSLPLLIRGAFARCSTAAGSLRCQVLRIDHTPFNYSLYFVIFIQM